MTQPPSMEYYSPSPNSDDLSHLKTLSICHYVWGGLTMFLSCIFIIHVVTGILIANGVPSNATWSPPTNTGSQFSTPNFPHQSGPPRFVGYIMAAMGGCAVLFGWALGTLTIISGRRIAWRRSRTFSIVMAGINCIYFPFGTVLGVFTIVVLAQDSVKRLYFANSTDTQSM